jgi:D-alanine-D-alanine ligase
MRILVLAGGTSNEREVSLRSGKCVVDALKKSDHEVFQYDPEVGLHGIAEYKNRVDAVFPILHGEGGEDGSIQTVLEEYGLKFLGASSSVSRLCSNKADFKSELQKLGILSPPGEVVTAESIQSSPLMNESFVLKPIDGGSSIDVVIARDPLHIQDDIGALFKKYPQMLLEKLIVGTEITVPVLGNTALPVIEIIPPEGNEFDYENKYNGKTQELCPPISVSKSLQKQAQRIAEEIHNKLGVRHFSRIDFMISNNGDVYALELNTIPGLTDQSLFPKSAQAAGMTMPDLVDEFVQMTTND